jgi:UDP-N-acetylglucosamine 4-epimerase
MTASTPAYDAARARLLQRPLRWLVTGAAGFIGSHLVEQLLSLEQRVVGLDNFATGSRENVAQALAPLSPEQHERFSLVEGDIRDPEACARACAGADVVLHQAALGSVPRSIREPMQSHDVNVTGFLQVLSAARAAGVRRVVYASSSSVYGDHPGLPKVESAVGRPLSPYAASKCADELYAQAFAGCYGLELIGLRYFNVFGPRQDPGGPYAAVIPLWFAGLLEGTSVPIFGDGDTSRDFCFVENVVQANLLAGTAQEPQALGQVFNIAAGERTNLNELFRLVRDEVARFRPEAARIEPSYRDFRPGDVRHSLADTGKAQRLLGYCATCSVREGLSRSARWYEGEATSLGTSRRALPSSGLTWGHIRDHAGEPERWGRR